MGLYQYIPYGCVYPIQQTGSPLDKIIVSRLIGPNRK